MTKQKKPDPSSKDPSSQFTNETKIKLNFTETAMFQQMLDLILKIYDHELCTPELRRYIYFETKRLFKGYDVARFFKDRGG